MRYEEFYKANRARLVGIAYRILRDRSDAEDVVQNVCLVLLENWETLKPLDLEAYTSRMVHNAAIEELRGRIEKEEIAEELSPVVGGADQQIIESEYRKMLGDALAELPVNQRKALLLKQERGLSYGEIAGLMNETEDNVRQLISRARRQLAAKSIKRN